MSTFSSPQVIRSAPDTLRSYLKKVWYYRHLIVALARRDLKAKYAQTLIGIAWSVIQPLVTLFIFVFFFERVIPISNKISYSFAVFAFSGMIGWQYFTQHLMLAGTALNQEQLLIKKMYFPKLILLFSKALSGLADYSTSLLLLCLLLWGEGIPLQWQILLLPLILLLNIIVALSLSIWLSAFTIRYRDFHHIIPYLVNFGIWFTPVFYPATLLPDRFQFLLYFNPMAGVIELFRWSLIGQSDFSSGYWLGLSLSMVLFCTGIVVFVKMEDKVVDFI